MNHYKFQISNLIFLFAAGVLIVLLSACSQKEPPPNAQQGGLRIISMAPNLTEILFALGLDEEIVAVTNDSDYPPQAMQKRKVGSFWQPDIEAVLACRPTLVITESFKQQSNLAARLSEIGCRTIVLDVWNTEQLYKAIETIGTAAGRDTQASQMIERLRQKQQQIAARHRDVQNRPKVLWVIQRQPLRAAGHSAFPTELIEMAGGVNVVSDTIYQYPPIGVETLLSAGPDIIIEPTEENADPAGQLEAAKAFYAKYASVPAVQNGRIYVIDANKVSRLGPRLDEGMELVDQCLWPVTQP